MRKLLLTACILIISIFNYTSSRAAFLSANKTNDTLLIKPAVLNNNQQLLYCLEHHFSVRQYQKLIGKKLTLVQRVNYFLLKHKLEKSGNDTTGAKIGGFCLGFFLGPLGVLIAYLLKKNKERRIWSWIGFGTYVILSLVVIIIVISSIGESV